MWFIRTGFKLGMSLSGDKPGMVFYFNHFNKNPVG